MKLIKYSSFFNLVLIIFLIVEIFTSVTIVNTSTTTNTSNNTDEEKISKVNQMNSLINKYKLIVDGIDLSSGDRLIAKDEITVNQQIIIIPTSNTISSVEKYQFEEYFNKSQRERLIGRLLLEKTLGSKSYFYEFVNTFSVNNKCLNYNHFNDSQKDELTKRSINSHEFKNVNQEFETLLRKIPSNVIPSNMLTFDLYNWANSIVLCHGVLSEKKYFSEITRIKKFSINDKDKKDSEILLVPSINLIENSSFKHTININFGSSLFAYKDHIYLNSDRYIEETEEVFNEINFEGNFELFSNCGKVIDSPFHNEVIIRIKNENWSLLKFDLCNMLGCIQKNKYNNTTNSKTNPTYVLKYEYDNALLINCHIDQIKDLNTKNINTISNQLKRNGFSPDLELYHKSLLKCRNNLINVNENLSKTTIEDDIKSYLKSKSKVETKPENKSILENILTYTISQKKVINHYISTYLKRMIGSLNEDLHGSTKSKYC